MRFGNMSEILQSILIQIIIFLKLIRVGVLQFQL